MTSNGIVKVAFVDYSEPVDHIAHLTYGASAIELLPLVIDCENVFGFHKLF